MTASTSPLTQPALDDHGYAHSIAMDPNPAACRPLLPVQHQLAPASLPPALAGNSAPASSSLPFSSSSSMSSSSSHNSRSSTPSQRATNTSLQTTPEGLVPLSFSSASLLPAPLTLPEAVYAVPHGASSVSSPSTSAAPEIAATAAAATASAASTPSSAPMGGKNSSGLIRRISRGARFPRRRGSTTHSHRDQSAGPTVFRRKSENRGIIDSNVEISDLELEDHEDEAGDDVIDLPHNRAFAAGLGIYGVRSTIGSTSAPAEGGVAPTRQSVLEQGTFLTKVSKRRQKTMKFRLDQDSAKVIWDSSRSTKQFYIDDVREIRSGAQARNYREECGLSIVSEPLWFTVIYLDPARSKGRTLKTLHLIAPDTYVFQLWTKSLDNVSRSRIDLMAGLVGTAERSARILWRREMDKKKMAAAAAGRRLEEERVDLADVMAICRKLHINCTEATLRDNFAKADADGNGYLDQAEFVDFVTRMKERRDVRAVYLRYIPEGKSELDKEAFFRFLRESQNVEVDADLEHWTAVFEEAANSRSRKSSSAPPADGSAEEELPEQRLAPIATMSAAAFQSYLLTSPENAALEQTSPPHTRLDRPLNEYFVSSSHNTYLLGRQVAGESSTEAYISALQKGCRCIEIDCWNGSDGKPEVVHGRTLTSSVPFLDCIKVIAKYAFVSSPYPLIISLEVHCDAEQQRIMTDIMKAEFGDKLILKPLDSSSTTLPSPEDLRHKILIKVKAPMENEEKPPPVAELPRGRRQRSLSSPWSRPTVLDNSTVPNSPLLSNPPSMSPPERSGAFWSSPRTSATSSLTTTPAMLASSAEDSDSPPPSLAEGKRRRKTKTSGITKVLGELGVYTQGIKFANFHGPEAKTYNHVFSINENTLEKLSKPSSGTKELLDAHNANHLMRVYPSQSRVFSSNFDPIRAWRRGVQMAALNWQTNDLGLQINDAMFAAGSDRSGYVLKPEELRGGLTGADSSSSSISGSSEKAPPCPRRKTKKLVQFAVDIVSAQQLPRPRGLNPDANINPYVEFEMFCAEDKSRGIATGQGGHDASARNGVSGIGSPLRKRTRIVEGNGYDPNWNETLTLTLQTKYPSLVFVRWTVWNSHDGRSLSSSSVPLASFTAKLSSLRQGYRHIPLYDANGEQYLFSSLFCKIKKEDHVAIEENGVMAHALAAASSSSTLRSATSSAASTFYESGATTSTGVSSVGSTPPLEPVKAVCCPPVASGATTTSSGRGNFLKRAFSRSNSQRKRDRARDQAKQQMFQLEGSDFSRTSTIEKC